MDLSSTRDLGFEAHVGEHLGYSDWRPVTQQGIDLVADATGDHRSIHVDPEKAATGPYDRADDRARVFNVVAGPILVQQIYKVTGLSMQVDYRVGQAPAAPAPVPVTHGIVPAPSSSRWSATQTAAALPSESRSRSRVHDRPACVVDTIAAMGQG